MRLRTNNDMKERWELLEQRSGRALLAVRARAPVRLEQLRHYPQRPGPRPSTHMPQVGGHQMSSARAILFVAADTLVEYLRTEQPCNVNGIIDVKTVREVALLKSSRTWVVL